MEIFGNLPERDLWELNNRHPFNNFDLGKVNFVIVGANGFIGSWLSTYLTYLLDREIFEGTITLIVRRPEMIFLPRKILNSEQCRIVKSDEINKNSFAHLRQFSKIIVIYAATSTSLSGKQQKSQVQDVLKLPNNVINSLPELNISFIHLSSGGVYRPSARKLDSIPSDYPTLLESEDSYIQEKITLESWAETKLISRGITVRNPRLFAFYGPGLQLDRHYAIGDFVKNGYSKLPIEVTGNPSNLRSYLYPTDAIRQILEQATTKDLIHTQIGSRSARNLESVAEEVGEAFEVGVRISGSRFTERNNYVPQDISHGIEVDFRLGLETWKEWLKKKIR